MLVVDALTRPSVCATIALRSAAYFVSKDIMYSVLLNYKACIIYVGQSTAKGAKIEKMNVGVGNLKNV
jgi:hypothetical protein